MPKENVSEEDIPPEISDSDKYFVENIGIIMILLLILIGSKTEDAAKTLYI